MPAEPGGRQYTRGGSFPFGTKKAGTHTGSQSALKRFPFWCNKTKTTSPAGRTSSLSPPLHHRRLLCRRRPPFIRIGCTSCPPLNLAIVGFLPTFAMREEDPGRYK